MPETCCVEGCVPAKEDVTFFKFPNSRSLRRKWLDAIPSTSIKVTLDTVVCSRHFLAEQYEVVRQKNRLKAKVVPSVFDTIKNPTAKVDELITSLQTDINNERVASDITTDNNTNTEQRTNSPDHRLEEKKLDNESSMRNGLKEDIVKRTQPDNIYISITDSEISNKDIEDIITNYQIKQTRPVHHGTETEMGGNNRTDACIEVEVPAFSGEMQIVRNGEMEIGRNGEMEIGRNKEIEAGRNVETSQVIDVDDDAEPVFIEVSVGRGGQVQAASDQDCMMLLKSVQCEVDPSCLVFPEREPGAPDPGDDSDVVDLGDKREDPISLLTSSDDDDVIIEEPHYDMVEVSDETDEDDVPLVRLRQPDRRTDADLSKILWGQLSEYFCMECHYKSTRRSDYQRHLKQHSTAVQVCELCGYTTASRNQYVRHKRKHRDERRHRCPLCKYKARHSMSLSYHMRCHERTSEVLGTTGVFKCDKCSFKTSAKDKLSRHVRTCASECKKFSCAYCNYESKRRSDLRRHCERRHGGNELDQVI